ncbi:MAG: tRNA (adenosine(37)-N6)-dimethylallyltransferase MiaA [Patescibacteria group bacterium]|nr:tRNA (adenosine(37)-N6)-dimethylallyltransferase MiaA [Patescibacteria group bacterium]
MDRQKVLVIVGPTSSGKSGLAVELAKELDGEVISADSRQVYRGLDIGSGKITKQEMKGVPHHLLDIASPRGQFTVAKYKKLAQKKIREITERGHLPIICGGTGLYIQAALNELSLPAIPPNLELRKELERWRATKLFKKLQVLDPARVKNIDKHNPRRLIRAIEIASATRTSNPPKDSPSAEGESLGGQIFDTFWIGLNPGKQILQEKINKRLQQRLRRGLTTEVKNLHAKQKISWQRLDDFGLEYRYVADFLRKQQNNSQREKISLLRKLEITNWQYAKRQMTWFKRDSQIQWMRDEHPSSSSGQVAKMMPQIKTWRSRRKQYNTDTKRQLQNPGDRENRASQQSREPGERAK